MCTISMPADYEMLISHSPPVFSHSPPVSYLSNYPSFRYDGPYPRHLPRSGYRVQPPAPITLEYSPPTPMPDLPASPRRPCLVLRPDDTTPEESDPSSPTRHKKKVVFADDRGMSLTQVRFMTEPSGVPPVWSSKFLAQVTKGLCAEVAPEPWEVTFAQPASDYLDFRRRLDEGNVSLENVIVKESEECIIGTIKVRNIAFQKEVFVRSSSDDWKTHQDTFCKFVNNNPAMQAVAGGHYVLYDTFSFRLTLPPRSRRIEFCVCFRCDGKEYWDNNIDKNYILVKKVFSPMPKSNSADDLLEARKSLERSKNANHLTKTVRCADALQAKLDSWSKFASWNHLEINAPYW